MDNSLFESDNYTLDKVNEYTLTITHKPTSQRASFDGWSAQGIMNTMHQQSDTEHEYSETLERIGNALLSKKAFK